jgi:hypothetical protein
MKFKITPTFLVEVPVTLMTATVVGSDAVGRLNLSSLGG